MDGRRTAIAVTAAANSSQSDCELFMWRFRALGFETRQLGASQDKTGQYHFKVQLADLLKTQGDRHQDLCIIYFEDAVLSEWCRETIRSTCSSAETILLTGGPAAYSSSPLSDYGHFSLSSSSPDASVVLTVLQGLEDAIGEGRGVTAGLDVVRCVEQQIDSRVGRPTATFQGNRSPLSLPWLPQGVGQRLSSVGFEVSVSVPHGAFDDKSVEGRSVGALLRRICSHCEVRVLVERQQGLAFQGPPNAGPILHRKLEHLCAAANLPAPTIKRHTAEGRYYATMPSIEQARAFGAVSLGLPSLATDGVFNFLGLVFRFELVAECRDMLIFQGLVRLKEPDATTRLVVEDISALKEHFSERSSPKKTQPEPLAVKSAEHVQHSAPHSNGASIMKSPSPDVTVTVSPLGRQEPQSQIDFSRSSEGGIAKNQLDEILGRIASVEQKQEALRDQSTHALVEMDHALAEVREKAADHTLVEQAIAGVKQGHVDRPFVEDQCRAVEHKVLLSIEDTVNSLRKTQQDVAALTSKLDQVITNQSSLHGSIQAVEQRLGRLEGNSLSRQDPLILGVQERQTACQVAINELHRDIRAMHGELANHATTTSSALQQVERACVQVQHEARSQSQQSQQRPVAVGVTPQEVDARCAQVEAQSQRQFQIIQEQLRKGLPESHSAVAAAGLTTEEKAEIKSLVATVQELSATMDAADPDQLARATERNSSEVKEIKKRINRIELGQANLEGLVSEEENRQKKMSSLVSRVDSIETVVQVLNETQHGSHAGASSPTGYDDGL